MIHEVGLFYFTRITRTVESSQVCLTTHLIFYDYVFSFQPVEVCVPYHRPKRTEVVVQKFDGQSWSTLPTVLRRGSKHRGRPPRVKHPRAKSFITLTVFSLTVKNFNISVQKMTSSWPAAQCASSPGLWLCPDQ